MTTIQTATITIGTTVQTTTSLRYTRRREHDLNRKPIWEAVLIVLVRRQVRCHTYTMIITSIYLDHHHTYVHGQVYHPTTLSWSPPPHTWITTIPITGSCSSSYLHYHDHYHIPRWPPYLYTVTFIITPPHTGITTVSVHRQVHHHITLSWPPPYTRMTTRPITGSCSSSYVHYTRMNPI